MGKTVGEEQQQAILMKLKERFEANMARHENLQWPMIEDKLKANPAKLLSLSEMEATEGEPDVVAYDEGSDVYTFFDCSKESPKGRRSLCYDHTALIGRKKNPPKSSVMDVANDMGIGVLDEAQYRFLQQLGEFDVKTSSWLVTPDAIRQKGGAIFGDRRYDQTFIYHNGADSYYAARAFRGFLEV